MNRVVRHYPVAQLPEDLRAGLDPKAAVTVTIVAEDARPERTVSLEEIWAMRSPPFRTAQEIDDDLRRDRDEWDD
jgi:hypothetical protein